MAGGRSSLKPVRKAVIFDLYGTLADVQVDEESPRFWDALAREAFGGPGARLSGEELRGQHARLCREAAEHGRGEGFLLDTVFAGLLSACGGSSAPEEAAAFAALFRRHSLTRLERKPYTDGLLAALRGAGYRAGLVSNTEALLTDYDLAALNLAGRFDAVVLSSRAGVKKPDRRIFEMALGQLRAAPGECVFIGDNPADDIAGALSAGMDAVYLAEEGEAPEIAGRRAVRAGFSLEEILAALRGLGFSLPQRAGG